MQLARLLFPAHCITNKPCHQLVSLHWNTQQMRTLQPGLHMDCFDCEFYLEIIIHHYTIRMRRAA